MRQLPSTIVVAIPRGLRAGREKGSAATICDPRRRRRRPGRLSAWRRRHLHHGADDPFGRRNRGGFVATPGGRSAAAGALLCIAGAATLASVGWGLKDEGLYCVAVMLIALLVARRLTSDPQRVCAERRRLSHDRRRLWDDGAPEFPDHTGLSARQSRLQVVPRRPGSARRQVRLVKVSDAPTNVA